MLLGKILANYIKEALQYVNYGTRGYPKTGFLLPLYTPKNRASRKGPIIFSFRYAWKNIKKPWTGIARRDGIFGGAAHEGWRPLHGP